MPAILIQILVAFAASFFARVLLGAGLTIYTYKLISDLVTKLQNQLSTYLYALPSDALAFIHILKIDFYISALMSAYTIVAFVKATKVFVGRK